MTSHCMSLRESRGEPWPHDAGAVWLCVGVSDARRPRRVAALLRYIRGAMDFRLNSRMLRKYLSKYFIYLFVVSK